MDLPIGKPRRAASRRVAENAKMSDRARVREAAQQLTARAGRMRLAWRFILITLLICLAAMVWLSQTSTLVSLGYEIENMNKQELLLNRQAEQLQSDVAGYESLQRIDQEARTKLGMIPAKQSVYVKVPANQVQSQPAASSTDAGTNWWRDLGDVLPKTNKPTSK